MKYRFRYKNGLFWTSKTVVGHRWDKDQDKMVLYKHDGAIEEIACWSKCSVRLGIDWVLAQKKAMEKQVGQPIVLDK